MGVRCKLGVMQADHETDVKNLKSKNMKFNWNPDLYDDKHDFVFKFGEEIVKLLNLKREKKF